MRIKYLLITLLTLNFFVVQAQRVSVLNQIDLPHNYYYHELYLPQLTSGPSSVAWMPDGKSLIYSKAGSLWIQNVGSEEATQLTDDDGYDYQPDVSPDGKQVLFVRYNGASMDVMVLSLEKKKSFLLTDGKSVSLEPRWSPDGSRFAFVSTEGSGHFLLHTAVLNGNQITEKKILIPDRKTEAKRYYYSAFDHAINPAWSKDGKTIYFISNHDVVHGTGNLSSINLASGEIKTIQKEETSWRMRPDVSPDDTRIVYSSYLGQNWHQLWMLPVEGGYPVPLTYGEYDKSAPRWSPDGKQIAFISNKDGNTSLWLLNAFTGKQAQVNPNKLNYLKPHARLTLQIQDEENEESTPLTARVTITDSRGKFYGPSEAWIHSDDSRYASIQKFETQYFHSSGSTTLLVPKDTFTITVSHGPMYGVRSLRADMRKADASTFRVKMSRLTPPDFGSWWSGDVHVHMNYGGNYRNTPGHLEQQAVAEDLQFVFNLIVNKEQRFPDIAYFSSSEEGSTKKAVILHGQEFHTSNWGHLGLLNLTEHLILPGYSAYPKTGVSSFFPHNSFIADRAHEQNALVGYVHPYETSDIIPEPSPTMTHALPVDAALGKVDYVELIGFADPIATGTVWYHLLNSGIRLAAAAGTDAMANYASLRGPVGLNRVYVRGTGWLNSNEFLQELKMGKSFVTNGPIIGFTIGASNPGDSIKISAKGETISYKAILRSNAPVDHIEIVFNGEVIAKHVMGPTRILDIEGKVKIKESGWILFRAWNSVPNPNVLDSYPYASTNPIFIGGPPKSSKAKVAGEYFVKWLDRIEKMTLANPSFRTETERTTVLGDIRKAKAYYQSLTVTTSKK